MAEVIPFRGICYDPQKIDAAQVMAPPYDVISPAAKQALFAKSPFNIVHIDAGQDLPEDNETGNKYTRAASFIDEWQKKGVLKEAERPCLYAYEVRYLIKGKPKKLLGVFAMVKLQPLGQGVYPHECTHSKARSDRLSLIKATGMNTSPVFSFYENTHGGTSGVLNRFSEGGVPPFLEASDADGFRHRLWVIDSPEEIAAFRKDLEGKPVFIADGHHRYETALEHQRQRREELGLAPGQMEDAPFNYVMMFLANISDGGLTVLPTHRLLKLPDPSALRSKVPDVMGEHFETRELPPDTGILQSMKGMKNTFGIYTGGKGYIAVYDGMDLGDFHPALRELDVVILHEFVLGKKLHPSEIAYEMDPSRATELVDSGQWDAAFFLNPTSVNEVMEVALSGQRMPPKSTYFYPKIMTGFVMGRVDGPGKNRA